MHTCVLAVTDTSVAVIFLSQLMFIFPLFSGMVINAKEFETKEIQKLTEIKKLTATHPRQYIFTTMG